MKARLHDAGSCCGMRLHKFLYYFFSEKYDWRTKGWPVEGHINGEVYNFDAGEESFFK